MVQGLACRLRGLRGRAASDLWLWIWAGGAGFLNPKPRTRNPKIHSSSSKTLHTKRQTLSPKPPNLRLAAASSRGISPLETMPGGFGASPNYESVNPKSDHIIDIYKSSLEMRFLWKFVHEMVFEPFQYPSPMSATPQETRHTYTKPESKSACSLAICIQYSSMQDILNNAAFNADNLPMKPEQGRRRPPACSPAGVSAVGLFASTVRQYDL